jgi:transaldolase
MITTADVRNAATSCARSTTRPAARTAGSPSRSTRGWRTTPSDHRRGQAAVVAGRPAEPVIKIPATEARAAGDHRGSAEGISVNVTLIFSLERYRAVMDAFLAGLEQAKANGHDLSKIHSVASFFVSRVDTEIDKRLDKIGTDEAKALRGKAAIANARLAYEAYEEVFGTDRWGAWPRRRANRSVRCGPRPASRTRPTRTPCTSTSWSPPNTVNTMPEATLDAVRRPRRDHRATPSPARTSRPAVFADARRSASRTTTSSGPGGRGRREVRGGLDRPARSRPRRS